MDTREIGEVLRNERINQGLSLDDVHDKTKISPYVLQNIEEGILDYLPHPVYVKGFIKSYANVLGLDAEELGSQFMRNMSLQEEERENEDRSISHSAHRIKLILVIILLVLMMAGWFVFKGFYLDSFKDTEQLENRTQENHEKIKPEEDVAAVNATPDRDGEFNKTESIRNIMQKNSTAGENSTNQTDKDGENDSHVVTVVARESCWLLAEVDGRVKDVYLNSGEDMDLTFVDSLQLKLGNAGGVELLYDGEEYPLDAEPGEVRILNFP
ncbi:MAG: helix-turn-helix domain-containing protein [Thermodesulfobacteriota bacterium]